VTGDPYLDLRSGVFRNRLGLTDRAELATAEKRFTTARIGQLKRRRLPGTYDLEHLRVFHWTIFQDVYPWAGQLRTVLIVKAGASFCLPSQIESTAADVFGRLAEAHHLRGRDRHGFLDGLSTLLAEVNALHPFREGNGRTQRAFLSQLARDAGYRLRWEYVDRDANIDAARAAADGDLAPMRALLEPVVESVRPRQRR
jgi:cell filamentation protein, protein adenylyltransferase